ncbi:hypothetical protein BU17DRAFT_70399 [Hysterangium stoloniferum]|nr:hypothetical protein BU17DRAFT_70399 [Hysterangium stoloniferum]
MTITIYDVPGQTGKSFIPLCGIPYNTVWVEYPEIAATMRKIGAAPTSTKPDGSPHYTVPVISDPDHPSEDGSPTVISDSWKIVEYLEETYPSSGVVFPSGTKSLQFLFQQHLSKALISVIIPAYIFKMFQNIQDGSKEYFRQTRETFFNKKLEELHPEGSEEWKEAWKSVEKGFADLALVLDKNGEDSHCVLEGTITYADFILASFLDIIATFTPEKWEEEIKLWDNGRWAIAMGKCLPYFEKA